MKRIARNLLIVGSLVLVVWGGCRLGALVDQLSKMSVPGWAGSACEAGTR